LQVQERLDEVLAQVDLTERFNELVGVPGISGLPTEARKRLTIAVELMANPPVIFMDDPTSGVLGCRSACVTLPMRSCEWRCISELDQCRDSNHVVCFVGGDWQPLCSRK
jgi:ABC-type Na+ transport system ATPase subunit NatA